MQPIVQWLEGLGLGHYGEAFVQAAIDLSVVPDLTDADLEKLGVLLGHRKKLLRAIAALSKSQVSRPESPSPAEAPASRAEAERRQVTIMFCDLVGSTELASRLDPEDLREVIGRYHARVAETVRRFDGFVAKYMGDGVLVYFGYPHAHEDDAEQAVRVGLALVDAVGELQAPERLQVRIGIATGLVVVGDLTGEGEARERGIVGETPNLAARLQALANPSTVVISDSTRRQIGSLFELRDLGPQLLKGYAEEQSAWCILSENRALGRFEALRSGATPLVGRGAELETLLCHWTQAKAGSGRAVLISGEPGIGKSRLVETLAERIAGEPHIRLRYFCSPQHTDSTLHPIIGQMERAARLTHDDFPEQKLDKLDAVLAQTATSVQDAELFAEMLSLTSDGRYPALALSPQQRRQRTLEALTTQVTTLTRKNPVLMLFEDAHWIDPTSLEALGLVVDRIRALRVLLIVTFRPEFEPPWVGRPHVTTLTINRLAERDVAVLIDRVIGDKLLPASVRQDIIERTDGVPLFVEEVTKAILEAGSENAVARALAAVPSPAVAVPASLYASLMARLDRLGPAKDVAQIGAAIGREFWHTLLVAVAEKPEAELQAALDRLVRAGLLFQQGAPPHARYVFKHALVQDAAYGTLLRESRHALHGRISQALVSQFPEIAEGQPELLAHHYAEAGLIEKAAWLWGKAGQRSLARSALVEAAEQLRRALAALATLPCSPTSRREEIMLQAALRHALMHLKGYSAPETKAAVERTHLLIKQAEALGEPPEDPLLLFSVLNGLWTTNIVAFNGDEACELAADFLARAESQNLAGPIIDGHRIVGTSLLMTGDIAEARADFDRGIALPDPISHGALVTGSAADSKAVMLGFRSVALWLLGYPKAALADADHALSKAREITPVGTLMHTLSWTIVTRVLCGQSLTTISSLVKELVALADEKGTLFWKAWGMMINGWLLALTGNTSNAVHTIRSGMDAWRSTGATMFLPFYSAYLAKACAQLGLFEEARGATSEAITMIKVTNERWFESEINRIAGEIALTSPEVGMEKAEAFFQCALSIARRQQAKSWELRASTSLARLWRDQGKISEAHDLLAPIYGWFTEGFGTNDLSEAKTLLDELGAALGRRPVRGMPAQYRL